MQLNASIGVISQLPWEIADYQAEAEKKKHHFHKKEKTKIFWRATPPQAPSIWEGTPAHAPPSELGIASKQCLQPLFTNCIYFMKICCTFIVSVQPLAKSYAWIYMNFFTIFFILEVTKWPCLARSFGHGKRFGQSYYRTLIESRMCSV